MITRLGLPLIHPGDQQTTSQRPAERPLTNKETKRKENKASAKADGFLRPLGDGIEPEAITLAEAWSCLNGVRRADPFYVSEGLSRGGIGADEVEGLLYEMSPDDAPLPDETLWAWYRRVTGDWLGSEVQYS